MNSLSLKDILIKYPFKNNLLHKDPTISNSGYSLDFYSPDTFYLIPDAFIELPLGFGINIPFGYVGLMTSKAKNSIKLSVGPGQIIYPQYEKQLVINLIYIGRTEERVCKGDPLFQVTLIQSGVFSYD